MSRLGGCQGWGGGDRRGAGGHTLPAADKYALGISVAWWPWSALPRCPRELLQEGELSSPGKDDLFGNCELRDVH